MQLLSGGPVAQPTPPAKPPAPVDDPGGTAPGPSSPGPAASSTAASSAASSSPVGSGTVGSPSTPAQDATALERALFEVKRVIVGQDRMIERMLVCLLSRGHCLLEGVPGVAKTLAVETLAKVVGGTFSRIQFTPDLVPADILGTRVYRASQVLDPATLVRLQRTADKVFVHNALVDYAVRLVLCTRTPADHGLAEVAGLISYGASPRASLGLVAATRALALMRGRDYALP